MIDILKKLDMPDAAELWPMEMEIFGERTKMQPLPRDDSDSPERDNGKLNQTKHLKMMDILNKLSESDDEEIFGEGTKSVDVVLMPPLPRDESDDSDDSDSPERDNGKLNQTMLEVMYCNVL